MNEKKLFLLDAFALIYRAYYAFINNPRMNSKGQNTSAVFGFINTILDVINKEKPTHMAVVFDPSKSFRQDIYPDYKAHREETPEGIRFAIPYIKKILEAMNIAVIQVENYEADDVIGALSNKASKFGFQTYMMTSDKDYCQLVKDNVFMYKPGRSGGDVEILGVDEVKKKFTIEHPDQVRDILALWGDASDNIPGAKGVGEKTARKLVGDFKTVENLIENYSSLTGKIKETIFNNIENIKLSKILVTIDLNTPIELDENQLLMKGHDTDALQIIFDELEFKNLQNRFRAQNPAAEVKKTPAIMQPSLFDDMPMEQPQKTLLSITDAAHDYKLLDTPELRFELIEVLKNQKRFCFDTETTGLDVYHAQLVGISIAYFEGEAFYIPIPADRTEAQKIVNEFKSILENTEIEKIGQNLKFDILVLKNYTVFVQGLIFDTMLAHYILQPEQRHNMDVLAENYLGYKTVSIEELIGKKGEGQGTMRSVEINKIKNYACEDADITLKLASIFEKELKELHSEKLSQTIEMPLVVVLADMEWEGVRINSEALNVSGDILRADLIQLESEIIELAGGQAFNISSPKQLGEVLFERLKISDGAQKTKTKQYSTAEDVLEKLRDAHPIIGKILEFRSLRKLLSSYVESLPSLVNSKTGKIHTSFNQAVTATGRLSSNNPNLQNIPIREERGREIRKAFIPSNDSHVLLSADYSQIELRIMAHVSKDEGMIEAFMQDEDIHTATAAKIYGLPLGEVTTDMRRNAKTANFGIIYGISAYGLAGRLSIARKDAKELIDNYFKTFPGVRTYMSQAIADAREKGYVETIMGRRRYLPDINSRNGIVRGFAERNAINAPVQGSAADIIKLAMINIHSEMKDKNFKSRMILQVHDELVFDVLKDELETLKELVKRNMENAVTLLVPLRVEMGSGNNWLEAH